jgi:hypothetical protein
MARPTSDAEAIAWLVAQVPAFGSMVEEHLATFDELLPYVVFEDDFTRWFAARVRAGDEPEVRSFLSVVERLLTTEADPPASDHVWNLAAVAFVEGLQNEAGVVASARSRMGPNTTRAFDDLSRGS